jgi:nitrogen fixation/metabolism regulation signal transduction histidine kinase
MTMATRRRHIHHKLARSVFWGTTLLAAVISVVFWVGELKRSSDKTAVMLNQLLDTVESTAAIAAYSGNRQIGEDVLKGLLRNDIVHSAQISNGQGLELAVVRSTEVPRQDAVVRLLHSPFADGEVVGRLKVVPEARFTLQEARHSALVGALNSVILIAITALMVVGLVRALLTQPLVRVSARLHDIKAGDANRLEALARHRDDELGQLVEDINGLLETLEEKFTAEHQLRQEVQGMERQLRGIFETTSAGIFQLDGGGVLLTANPSLGRVLRWPAGIPGQDLENPLDNWLLKRSADGFFALKETV